MLLALLLSASVSCDRIKPLPKRADCERKAGHVLKALELIEDHLAKKPKDKKALKLRDALKALVVTVEWFSEPDGALVSVDGADPAGATPLTVDVDPGKHVFHFTHDGYTPLDREETAVTGTRPKLTAVLEKLPSAEPEPESAAPSPLVGERGPSSEPENLAAPSPAPPPSPPPVVAHSNAPLILGSAGLFVAIGGGVLILTSALAQPFDVPAQNRQYAGYALAGVGVACGIAAIIWLLIDRRPGATER